MTIDEAIHTDSIGYAEISKMIPHRYPFLLIDKVIKLDSYKSAIGIKNVTINEPFFQGHFPNHPVMPGVLIVEAMAQTAGVHVIWSMEKEKPETAGNDRIVYFMSVDSAKFRKPVGPGDQLYLYVETLQGRKNVWKYKSIAKVDNVVVAEATFTAMILDK
jgi:3-hydroxyacyl-[acyl-carrier-protein] dehydratase